jgi:uncharacterized membrane protein
VVSGAEEAKETGRVEAFSDGVFAIAITLLVLELKVPHLLDGGGGHLAAALLEEWPSYLGFVTSFATILIMWVSHHRMFSYIRRADPPFLFANGLLLFVVTLVPFPTAVLAEYFERPGATTAGAFYAGTFVLGAIAYNVLWRVAIGRGGRLLRPGVSQEHIDELTASYRWGIPVYVLATAAAFWSVHATIAICLGLWAYWVIVAARNA